MGENICFQFLMNGITLIYVYTGFPTKIELPNSFLVISPHFTGQHAALFGGEGGAAMYSTNEEVFKVFLASNIGKELVQAAARKVRR
jgi:hypothetical protein